MVTEGRLASPELALAEASNILRRLERTGQISSYEEGREAAHGDLLQLDVELFPFASPLPNRIWCLAQQP